MWVVGGKSWQKTAGRRGTWKRNDLFGSSQDLESILGDYRFENVFKLPLTPKPLTVFRIMSVFLMYRLSYLGCVMSLS